MARIVFVTGWLDVREDARTVRSAIHSALATDFDIGPQLITVTPENPNDSPVYVNPAQVVMVKTSAGEEAS